VIADGPLVIRDAASRAAAYFNIDSIVDDSGQRARLIFHRYGNQYFLAQIFDGQRGLGCALLIRGGCRGILGRGMMEAARMRDAFASFAAELPVLRQNG